METIAIKQEPFVFNESSFSNVSNCCHSIKQEPDFEFGEFSQSNDLITELTTPGASDSFVGVKEEHSFLHFTDLENHLVPDEKLFNKWNQPSTSIRIADEVKDTLKLERCNTSKDLV